MKVSLILAILLVAGCLTPAQTQDTELDLSGVMNAAQQWATNNLDDRVLRALSAVDQTKVQDFLNQFQARLQGDQVLDLGQFKKTATAVLPLLEAHEGTQPYAAWLKERLDYFDVADQLATKAPPPPPPEPGKPLPVRPNPSYQAEQTLWIQKVAPRPWPKGAAEVVPGLKKIFLSEHVPPGLVWLAEVESGFDRRARSPAGAVGMFQLMPATAKRYGLSLRPRDQREQTDPSARAAARNLNQLYTQFGDWRLVVAAYNAGAGNVKKLLDRYHTTNFERIAPHLPAETQLYVPKVAATLQHREGLELAMLKRPAPGVTGQ